MKFFLTIIADNDDGHGDNGYDAEICTMVYFCESL